MDARAFQHRLLQRLAGTQPDHDPGRTRIGARLVGGTLWLDVEDDGAEGLPDAEGHGIGLANTRARLQALYGDDAALSFETTEAGGTRVSLRLPRLQGAIVATRSDGARDIRFDEVTVR